MTESEAADSDHSDRLEPSHRSDPCEKADTGLSGWIRSPVPWAIALALGLATYLFEPLLFPSSHLDLELKGEQFFFEVNESAGAPVLVLAIWLFYRRSHLRDLLATRGNLIAGSGVLSLAVALYAWGQLTGADDLKLASLVILLLGVAVLLGGLAGLRAFWLPIVFMGFALPLSPVLISAVIWPVQLATAQAAGFVLNMIGVDSLVQGDQILRPQNTFVVIETCSGLRTLVTLTMLTILLIDLFERKGKHAIALLCLAPIVAFMTNSLRVVSLVLNPHSDVASIHNLQGIAMLLLGLTVMYGLDGLIERLLGDGEGDEPARDFGVLAQRAAPSWARTLRYFIPSLALIGMLVIGLAAKPWDLQRPMIQPDDLIKEALEGWRSREVGEDYQFRGSIHYRGWSRREVEVDGEIVEVFVGLSDSRFRRLSIFSPRLPWSKSGFEKIAESSSALLPGLPNARRLTLRRGATSMLSYAWYEPAYSLPIEMARQALALDSSPFARSRETIAIRLSTRFRPNSTPEVAQKRLEKIYRRIAPAMDELRNFVSSGELPAEADKAAVR